MSRCSPSVVGRDAPRADELKNPRASATKMALRYQSNGLRTPSPGFAITCV